MCGNSRGGLLFAGRDGIVLCEPGVKPILTDEGYHLLPVVLKE